MKIRQFKNRRKKSRARKQAIQVMLAIALFFSITLPLTTHASRLASGTHELAAREVSFLEQFEEIEVLMRPGQTAWETQLHLAPSHDVRKMLYYAERVNGEKMSQLQAGESYIFFLEKKETP